MVFLVGYFLVRWDVGLNKKKIAYFHLPKANDGKGFLSRDFPRPDLGPDMAPS